MSIIDRAIDCASDKQIGKLLSDVIGAFDRQSDVRKRLVDLTPGYHCLLPITPAVLMIVGEWFQDKRVVVSAEGGCLHVSKPSQSSWWQETNAMAASAFGMPPASPKPHTYTSAIVAPDFQGLNPQPPEPIRDGGVA